MLRGSKLMDRGWYARRYPDVAALGMDPVEHYLRYGAALGRNPGPRLRHRLLPRDLSGRGGERLNPLAHHLRHGARAGPADPSLRQPRAARRAPRARDGPAQAARPRLRRARARRAGRRWPGPGAIPALRAHAARELALWHLRAGRRRGRGGRRASMLPGPRLPPRRRSTSPGSPRWNCCAPAPPARPRPRPTPCSRAPRRRACARDDILLVARRLRARTPGAGMPWINRALALTTSRRSRSRGAGDATPPTTG